MRKYILPFICLAGMLVSLASCQKDNGQGLLNKDRDIRIKFGTENAVTKASPADNAEEILFSMPFVTENGDTLNIVASVSDRVDDMSSWSADTKATPITTDNLKTKYGKFKTSVYTESGSLYTDELSKTMDGVTVSYGSGEWNLQGAPYRWPAGADDLLFCSYAPLDEGTGISALSWNGGAKVTFDYENKPLGDQSGAYRDAENQKDIIFAINKQNRTAHDGDAYINFSHALVAVKFIKGDIDDCKLSQVTLEKFYSEGSATGTPNQTNADELDFAWSSLESLQDYSQTFTGAKNVNELADKASLDPTEDENYTFMIIPQELDADASVVLYLKYGDNTPQRVSINLGSITDELAGEGNAEKLKDWSKYAGKIITIRVNRAGIAVAVDETFDGSVKANVGAKNTGGKVEFVRATIVANWVDADGNICETCDFVHDVAIVDYLKDGCNWVYNEGDNFYYYKKAIVPGAVTKGKIFASYTAPAAPEEGLHLEMAVTVQGVEYDSSCTKAKAAWSIPDGILTSEIE